MDMDMDMCIDMYMHMCMRVGGCGCGRYSQLQPNQLNSIEIGPFVVSTIFATIIFAWITYDAFKLSCKMSPDEYLKGVIHFYTDMFYVCICCCVITCLGSA